MSGSRFKHTTCRLLRQKGVPKTNQKGHISGPKKCPAPKQTVDDEMEREKLQNFVNEQVCQTVTKAQSPCLRGFFQIQLILDRRCVELLQLHSIVADTSMFKSVSLSSLVTKTGDDGLEDLCEASEQELDAAFQDMVVTLGMSITVDEAMYPELKVTFLSIDVN